jgi:hypothetical protein
VTLLVIGLLLVRFLTNGTGTAQPTGLLTALAANEVTPVIATGSSESTGGSQTGANSIGYAPAPLGKLSKRGMPVTAVMASGVGLLIAFFLSHFFEATAFVFMAASSSPLTTS